MKFNKPPPYYPNCDITLNFTDCQYQTMHLSLYGVGAFVHVVVIAIACYILFRPRTVNGSQLPSMGPTVVGGNRLIGQPMKALCVCMACFLATRLLHNTLCAFDLMPSLAVRTAGVAMSCWVGYWGMLLFTAGIIETVQQTTGRLPGQRPSRLHARLLVRIPSRRLTLSLLAATCIIGSIVPAVLGFMGGLRGEQGDWEGHFNYVRLAWGIWGSIFVILGTFYAYYAVVLTMTLRQLMPQNQPFNSRNMPGSGHRRGYNIHTAYNPNQNGESDMNMVISQKKSNGDLYETTIGLTEINEDEEYTKAEDKKAGAKFGALYAYAMKSISKAETKSTQSVAASVDVNEEIDERSASITRLRGVLYYLIFFYFNCAVMSYIWGFGGEWLNAHPGLGTVIEVCFLVVLWPSLAMVFFWRFWQMERARERSEERRTASGGVSADLHNSHHRTNEHRPTLSTMTLTDEP
ncbi:hypothetical protein BDF19DRAFT_436882 [Syncephalis fuscata]|nr:hypothetical protein BDF19DRAFT_436882 [Syncephalis fuscata]